MEGLYSFRTIVSPSAYQAISSPWRISLGLSQAQTSIKLTGIWRTQPQQRHTIGKRSHLLQWPKSDRHRDIFFHSLCLQRRLSCSFSIKMPLLTPSRRRRRRALAINRGLQKQFRRRRSRRRRRISTFRATQSEPPRFHTWFRRHCHFSSNLQLSTQQTRFNN